MNKEFIPYKEALALKELEFDGTCFGYHYTLDGKTWQFADKTTYFNLDDELNIGRDFTISAPTYSQAFRWARENFFIYCEIGRDYDTWDYELYNFKNGNQHIPTGFKTFNTYEEAELACLKKLIEIVKNLK